MLVVDPTGIGARYTIAWLAAGVLSIAGRSGFDALIGVFFGPNGDAPPVVLMGTRKSCRVGARRPGGSSGRRAASTWSGC